MLNVYILSSHLYLQPCFGGVVKKLIISDSPLIGLACHHGSRGQKNGPPLDHSNSNNKLCGVGQNNWPQHPQDATVLKWWISESQTTFYIILPIHPGKFDLASRQEHHTGTVSVRNHRESASSLQDYFWHQGSLTLMVSGRCTACELPLGINWFAPATTTFCEAVGCTGKKGRITKLL